MPHDGSDSSIETALRTSVSSLSQMSGLVADADLTSFFPFDPYKLPKSSSYIQPVYREWSSVAIQDDSDDSDDDDDDSNSIDSSDELDRANASTPSDGGLPDSFGGMSISPSAPLHR